MQEMNRDNPSHGDNKKGHIKYGKDCLFIFELLQRLQPDKLLITMPRKLLVRRPVVANCNERPS